MRSDVKLLFKKLGSENCRQLTVDEVKYFQSLGLYPVGSSHPDVLCSNYFIMLVNDKYTWHLQLRNLMELMSGVVERRIATYDELPTILIHLSLAFYITTMRNLVNQSITLHILE